MINYDLSDNGIAFVFSAFWDQDWLILFQEDTHDLVLMNFLVIFLYYMVPEHSCAKI